MSWQDVVLIVAGGWLALNMLTLAAFVLIARKLG